MAVKIRLRKSSKATKKRYHFKIVVIHHTSARNGRFLDEIGYYDPSKNPALLHIDKEKLEFWLKRGAIPSDTIKSLIKKSK
jgi:small subunit ribosomal protein S16